MAECDLLVIQILNQMAECDLLVIQILNQMSECELLVIQILSSYHWLMVLVLQQGIIQTFSTPLCTVQLLYYNLHWV